MRNMLAALLALTAGCGVTPNEHEEGRPGQPVGPAAIGGVGASLALLPPGDAGNTATTAGTLELKEGCLYLRGISPVRTSLAFATADTAWDAQAGVLRIGDKFFAPGQRMSIGGSAFEGNVAALPWLTPPLSRCTGDRLWIVSSVE
jgi:hypothetical protein